MTVAREIKSQQPLVFEDQHILKFFGPMAELHITNLTLSSSHASPAHQHAQGQLFVLHSGLISIHTEQRRHLLPPACIAWIPPWKLHGAEIHQTVLAQRWYINANWQQVSMPDEIKMIRTSHFLSELMMLVSDLHRQGDQAYLIYLACLADQLQRQPDLPLSLAMPTHPRLQTLCQYYMAHPHLNLSLDQMAEIACMSRRSLSRHFLAQTGNSLGLWLQRMRIILAMEKLALGQSVTQIALELGYQSLSAFIKQFRRHLGVSPRSWQTQAQS